MSHRTRSRNREAATTVAEPISEIDQQLARHPTVVRLGTAVYTADGLRLFLTKPAPRFGGKTALDLLRSGEEEQVISALAADYEAMS